MIIFSGPALIKLLFSLKSPEDFEEQTKVPHSPFDRYSNMLIIFLFLVSAQLFEGCVMAPQFDLEHRNFLMMEYHKRKGHRDIG